MATSDTNDPFAAVRKAETSAPNFDLNNGAIVNHLIEWQSLCAFDVKEASSDSIDIEFKTLPQDMDAFVRDLYKFCTDLIDQGAGCVAEMVEMANEMGEELDPEMMQLIEGIDFNDENYGLEILKRELEARKNVKLWWD